MEVSHDCTRRGFPRRPPGLYERNRYSRRSAATACCSSPARSAAATTALPNPSWRPRSAAPSDNLNAVLAAAGCGFDDVLDVTVFMVDAEANFERIWKIVPEYWGEAPYPTLTAVGVNWLYGFSFEIKVVARLPEGR